MSDFLKYLMDRCREPSTWRGIMLVATAAGARISPEWSEAIITLGIALSGGIGIVTSDK